MKVSYVCFDFLTKNPEYKLHTNQNHNKSFQFNFNNKVDFKLTISQVYTFKIVKDTYYGQVALVYLQSYIYIYIYLYIIRTSLYLACVSITKNILAVVKSMDEAAF